MNDSFFVTLEAILAKNRVNHQFKKNGREVNRIKGLLWGVLSGASFGLIPLFTLALFASGFDTDSVLFYRFSTATLLLTLILLIRGENFRITLAQALRLALLGVLYLCSSLFLLWGYEYMAAGVATTVHFLYPVCVVLLMIVFFGERASITNIGAVILAILGVALLSSGGGAESGTVAVSGLGMLIVVISALAYALYIIGIKRMNLGSLGGFKLTFYVLLFTSMLFLGKAYIFGDGIHPISTPEQGVNIFLLALIPTVVSNFALVNAISIVGSTTTSILGAMEPMTAVVVGVTVYDEPMSLSLAIGVALIIGAVTTIVLKKSPKH